jgi:lipid-A-disaccharide synthase
VKAFLIAGEASGDALGAALMAGLRQVRPEIQFAGVGGVLMQDRGLASLFSMDELSIMGLTEVLPKYFHLKRRIRETAEAIAAEAPDVVVTIDSPDFCLRVLALAKAANPALKTVHYVAPSVWAWRPGRAKKMARVVDHVLALLPFEPPYMTAAGMSCDFVGHPAAAEPVASDADAQAFRETHHLQGADPLILVLAGSRRGEVTRLLPIFTETLKPIFAAHPGARVVMPTTGNVTDLVVELTKDWPQQPVLLDPKQMTPADYAQQKRAAFRAADVALAASGTVSLELAAAGTPMVMAYRLSPLSEVVIVRLLQVDTVTLVNLVSETRAVPDFIASHCTPEALTAALEPLLTEGGERQAQRAAMDLTMQRLGRDGEAPGLRAAKSVLNVLETARVSAGKPEQSAG